MTQWTQSAKQRTKITCYAGKEGLRNTECVILNKTKNANNTAEASELNSVVPLHKGAMFALSINIF